MNLLLLSNSTNFGDPYLYHAKNVIADFLESKTDVLFIPYAGVTISYDAYEEKVKEALMVHNINITSIHHFEDPLVAVHNAAAIAVGGGNTFQLLAMLQKLDLMNSIKAKIESGIPYIGWSAGSNIAGPTICTSNDMPIVQPKSFNALNFVPFQINPHYTEASIPNHGGETRVDRLREYLTLNPRSEVVCMPEGTWFMLKDNNSHVGGSEEISRMRFNELTEIVSDTTYMNYFAIK